MILEGKGAINLIDVNTEIEKILSELDVKVVYSSPAECPELPCVSFYMISEKGSFYADNDEEIYEAAVQIDVWADEGYKCGIIAMQIYSIMRSNGFFRELSRDIPKGEDGVYHRTMRFTRSYIHQV